MYMMNFLNKNKTKRKHIWKNKKGKEKQIFAENKKELSRNEKISVFPS